MSMKVVIFEVDDETLTEVYPGSDFESEIGCLEESGIHMREFIEIPAVAESNNAIEWAWIIQQADEQLTSLKETHQNAVMLFSNTTDVAKEQSKETLTEQQAREKENKNI